MIIARIINNFDFKVTLILRSLLRSEFLQCPLGPLNALFYVTTQQMNITPKIRISLGIARLRVLKSAHVWYLWGHARQDQVADHGIYVVHRRGRGAGYKP